MISARHLYRPPRLLLGAVVIFWGLFTDHPFIGLIAGVLVEACFWLDWRWKFETKGYRSAWILSLIFTITSLAYYYLNAGGIVGLLNFIDWLPLQFLPLILAQNYGQRGDIPFTAFSGIARLREKKARLAGRPFQVPSLHFGYPYLGFCLLSIGHDIHSRQGQLIFGGILGITFLVAFYYRSRRITPFLPSFIIASLLVIILGVANTIGLQKLYHKISEGRVYVPPHNTYSEDRQTGIGELGELKLSKRIHWRLDVPNGVPYSKLMMTASYNRYHPSSKNWTLKDPGGSHVAHAYKSMQTSAQARHEGEFAYEVEDFLLNDHEKPAFRLRGKISSARQILPLPESAQLLTNCEEIDAVDYNALGTVVAINSNPVVDYKAYLGSNPGAREGHPRLRLSGTRYRSQVIEEVAPLPSMNSRTAQLENAITQIVEDLGLLDLDEELRIKALLDYFSSFEYSTYLSIGDPTRNALEQFLTQTQSGHCGYFASAGALILRATGIPTRYAVGYAVTERSEQGGFNLRGTHSHAWCRVYLGGQQETLTKTDINDETGEAETFHELAYTGGRWVDVDFTPKGWLNVDAPAPDWADSILDSWQRWQEDFEVWRSQTDNKSWVNTVLLAIAAVVFLFLLWRLSHSRMKTSKQSHKASPYRDATPTSFQPVIKLLEKHCGKRPLGQLLSVWFEQLPLPHEQKSSLKKAMSFHERSRFQKGSLSETEQHEFENLSRGLNETYAQVFKKG